MMEDLRLLICSLPVADSEEDVLNREKFSTLCHTFRIEKNTCRESLGSSSTTSEMDNSNTLYSSDSKSKPDDLEVTIFKSSPVDPLENYITISQFQMALISKFGDVLNNIITEEVLAIILEHFCLLTYPKLRVEVTSLNVINRTSCPTPISSKRPSEAYGCDLEVFLLRDLAPLYNIWNAFTLPEDRHPCYIRAFESKYLRTAFHFLQAYLEFLVSFALEKKITTNSFESCLPVRKSFLFELVDRTWAMHFLQKHQPDKSPETLIKALKKIEVWPSMGKFAPLWRVAVGVSELAIDGCFIPWTELFSKFCFSLCYTDKGAEVMARAMQKSYMKSESYVLEGNVSMIHFHEMGTNLYRNLPELSDLLAEDDFLELFCDPNNPSFRCENRGLGRLDYSKMNEGFSPMTLAHAVEWLRTCLVRLKEAVLNERGFAENTESECEESVVNSIKFNEDNEVIFPCPPDFLSSIECSLSGKEVERENNGEGYESQTKTKVINESAENNPSFGWFEVLEEWRSWVRTVILMEKKSEVVEYAVQWDHVWRKWCEYAQSDNISNSITESPGDEGALHFPGLPFLQDNELATILCSRLFPFLNQLIGIKNVTDAIRQVLHIIPYISASIPVRKVDWRFSKHPLTIACPMWVGRSHIPFVLHYVFALCSMSLWYESHVVKWFELLKDDNITAGKDDTNQMDLNLAKIRCLNIWERPVPRIAWQEFISEMGLNWGFFNKTSDTLSPDSLKVMEGQLSALSVNSILGESVSLGNMGTWIILGPLWHTVAHCVQKQFLLFWNDNLPPFAGDEWEGKLLDWITSEDIYIKEIEGVKHVAVKSFYELILNKLPQVGDLIDKQWIETIVKNSIKLMDPVILSLKSPYLHLNSLPYALKFLGISLEMTLQLHYMEMITSGQICIEWARNSQSSSYHTLFENRLTTCFFSRLNDMIISSSFIQWWRIFMVDNKSKTSLCEIPWEMKINISQLWWSTSHLSFFLAYRIPCRGNEIIQIIGELGIHAWRPSPCTLLDKIRKQLPLSNAFSESKEVLRYFYQEYFHDSLFVGSSIGDINIKGISKSLTTISPSLMDLIDLPSLEILVQYAIIGTLKAPQEPHSVSRHLSEMDLLAVFERLFHTIDFISIFAFQHPFFFYVPENDQGTVPVLSFIRRNMDDIPPIISEELPQAYSWEDWWVGLDDFIHAMVWRNVALTPENERISSTSDQWCCLHHTLYQIYEANSNNRRVPFVEHDKSDSTSSVSSHLSNTIPFKAECFIPIEYNKLVNMFIALLTPGRTVASLLDVSLLYANLIVSQTCDSLLVRWNHYRTLLPCLRSLDDLIPEDDEEAIERVSLFRVLSYDKINEEIPISQLQRTLPLALPWLRIFLPHANDLEFLLNQIGDACDVNYMAHAIPHLSFEAVFPMLRYIDIFLDLIVRHASDIGQTHHPDGILHLPISEEWFVKNIWEMKEIHLNRNLYTINHPDELRDVYRDLAEETIIAYENFCDSRFNRRNDSENIYYDSPSAGICANWLARYAIQNLTHVSFRTWKDISVKIPSDVNSLEFTVCASRLAHCFRDLVSSESDGELIPPLTTIAAAVRNHFSPEPLSYNIDEQWSRQNGPNLLSHIKKHEINPESQVSEVSKVANIDRDTSQSVPMKIVSETLRFAFRLREVIYPIEMETLCDKMIRNCNIWSAGNREPPISEPTQESSMLEPYLCLPEATRAVLRYIYIFADIAVRAEALSRLRDSQRSRQALMTIKDFRQLSCLFRVYGIVDSSDLTWDDMFNELYSQFSYEMPLSHSNNECISKKKITSPEISNGVSVDVVAHWAALLGTQISIPPFDRYVRPLNSNWFWLQQKIPHGLSAEDKNQRSALFKRFQRTSLKKAYLTLSDLQYGMKNIVYLEHYVQATVPVIIRAFFATKETFNQHQKSIYVNHQQEQFLTLDEFRIFFYYVYRYSEIYEMFDTILKRKMPDDSNLAKEKVISYETWENTMPLLKEWGYYKGRNIALRQHHFKQAIQNRETGYMFFTDFATWASQENIAPIDPNTENIITKRNNL